MDLFAVEVDFNIKTTNDEDRETLASINEINEGSTNAKVNVTGCLPFRESLKLLLKMIHLRK